MTKVQSAPGIFVVRFTTQYELASTFLRVQEHYESTRFKNRVFTLEEYMDWYAERFGAFTYFEDWSGFNVPSTALRPFYDGTFDPLREKERRLLAMFRRIREPFYVIGIASEQDLHHELAHALYYMQPEYRKAVNAAMRNYSALADATPAEWQEVDTQEIVYQRHELHLNYRMNSRRQMGIYPLSQNLTTLPNPTMNS